MEMFQIAFCVVSIICTPITVFYMIKKDRRKNVKGDTECEAVQMAKHEDNKRADKDLLDMQDIICPSIGRSLLKQIREKNESNH